MNWVKIFFLLKSTVWEVCCRKKLFCGITVILIISFLIVDYSLILFGSVFARKGITSRIVRGDSEYIYFLNLEKYKMMEGGTSDRLDQLLKDIEKVEGVEIYGTYWDGENLLLENESEYPAVSISETLIDLCEIGKIDSHMLERQKDTGYMGVIAGYELGKIYPVGTVFTDYYTENKCIVTYTLPKNSRWLDEDVKNGIYIDLDRHFLVGTQFYLSESTIFIGNGINNFCYRISSDADGEKIKEQVKNCAEKLDIDIYNIQSLREKVECGWLELQDAQEELYLSVFLMLCAVLAMLTASMITIYIRKKDIGVLYANGYSKLDVINMYIIENVCKVMIGFMTALAFWNIEQYTIFEKNISVMWILVPWSFLAAMILILLGSIVPFFQIRRLQPVDLIGKHTI